MFRGFGGQLREVLVCLLNLRWKGTCVIGGTGYPKLHTCAFKASLTSDTPAPSMEGQPPSYILGAYILIALARIVVSQTKSKMEETDRASHNYFVQMPFHVLSHFRPIGIMPWAIFLRICKARSELIDKISYTK